MNAEELIGILRQGEGTRVEFKSDFPAQSHAIGKEMAALANTGGGILLMGVTDDGAPKGIEDADRVVERLAGIAHSCGLSVSPEIDKFQVSKNIFIVYARIRACPPCFYQGKIYHRVGSTSVECSSGDQLRNILSSGSHGQISPPRHAERPRPRTGGQPAITASQSGSEYWFVNVGDGAHRNWDDNREYGYLSAGGGAIYSQAMKRLQVGDKIFAYLNRVGYVGCGLVTSEAVMIKDFSVSEYSKMLLDLPLRSAKAAANLYDPNLCEWVIGIRWLKAMRREDAKRLKGVPVYRSVVCRLKQQETVGFLEREFGIRETGALGETGSRKSEKVFFGELERRSPADASVARKLLEWSRKNFDQVKWNGASFVPVLDYGGDFTQRPITVFVAGKVPRVGIKFGRLKNRNGMSEEKRIELRRRLNAIPGVNLPMDSIDKYPNILLASLANDRALDKFLEAIAWANEEVKFQTQ